MFSQSLLVWVNSVNVPICLSPKNKYDIVDWLRPVAQAVIGQLRKWQLAYAHLRQVTPSVERSEFNIILE